MTLKTVISVLVQIQKVIFCVYWIFQFEGHSMQCSQLTIKALDNLTNNRRLFNCDKRRIETHQLLITSLYSQ